MGGGIGFAVSMFWLAWTANYDFLHWIVPTLAGVFLAASMMLIFMSGGGGRGGPGGEGRRRS